MERWSEGEGERVREREEGTKGGKFIEGEMERWREKERESVVVCFLHRYVLADRGDALTIPALLMDLAMDHSQLSDYYSIHTHETERLSATLTTLHTDAHTHTHTHTHTDIIHKLTPLGG